MIPERPHDWSDCHKGPVRAEFTSARQVFDVGLSNMPGWARSALALRDRVVGPLGLKTAAETGTNPMSELPIVEDTPERFTAGLEDAHLTFFLTTELNKGQTAVTTRIWFNNPLGRVYLALVMGPHKLILRQILRGVA